MSTPPTAPTAPTPQKESDGANIRLTDIARYLHGQGFNIVWVDDQKKPLGRWSASERLHDPERPPRGAAGIAITGGYFEDRSYVPLVLDIDAPKVALPKLSAALGDDALKVLCGQPWSFCGLTGPRPKGQVKCSGDTCTLPDGSTVPVDQVERGMYIVVRVPARCAPKHTMRYGDIEIMVNNYQVVYGLHPSGLHYQFVRYEDGRLRPLNVEAGELPGAGVILTCDELARIVSTISSEERREEEEPEVEESLPVEGERHSLSDPQKLLARLKELWPVVRPEGGHFHDVLLFAVASLGRRLGIPAEELEPVFNELFAWAVQNGLDDEKTIREHENQWKQAYKPDAAYWGRRSLKRIENEIRKICYAAGYNEARCGEVINDIYAAFGAAENSYFCTPDRYKGKNYEVVESLCNTPRGIVHRKLVKSRNEETGEVDIEPDERVLLEIQLLNPRVYEEVITGVEYITTKVRNVRTGHIDDIGIRRVDEFVEEMNRKTRHRRTLDWQTLLNSVPRIKDIVVSGFACAPPNPIYSRYKIPCGVRDYFNAGLLKSVEKHEARQVVERLLDVLDKFAPNDLWLKQMWSAITHGSFGNFMLTRKLHQLKAWLTVYVGPPNTGKTTAAYILLYSFYPNYVNMLLSPAGRQFTPARIGRLQSSIVTGLAVLDEVEAAIKNPETLTVLKSYVTSLTAWITATGQVFPAYAGLVLAANSFHVPDPALRDKIVMISMTEEVDSAKADMFTAQVPWDDLVKFGSYYLLYAERNWDSVKDIVLAARNHAPREYMKAVMEDLGLNMPDLVNPDEPPVPTASSKFWSVLHDEVVKVANLEDKRGVDLTEFLNTAIEKSLLKLVRLYTADGKQYVRIVRDEVESHGINIDQLCKELGGSLITQSRSYYKHCIVPRERFEDLLHEFINPSLDDINQ